MAATPLVVLAALISVAHAAPATPYTKVERQKLIRNSLEAFKHMRKQSVDNIEQFFGLVSRSTCRSDDEALRIACFEQEARKNCASGGGQARSRCIAISDLIIVNQLNEKQFISLEDRAGLFRKAGTTGYSAGYAGLVTRKYAALTAELLLLSNATCDLNEPGCLAGAIDDYCLQNGDVKGLPWQGCVSGIVWFIGAKGV
jgi:hypothetical protein